MFAILVIVAACLSVSKAATVDFARDVQPLLQKRCVTCHGPDQQMASLRFDDRDAASPVIRPGNAAASRLIQMVTEGRNGKVMPPAGPRLTAAEVDILRQWIDQGAQWPQSETARRPAARSAHWAFQPIRRVASSSTIDAFILACLQKEGVAPSPEADRRTLIRRLSFDLIGLPPTPDEISAYLADSSPAGYERVVDRLLASPHYGEKWARHWLDLARYADSDGYEQDSIRPHAWRYRDWVIHALNRNMPFDQFTIEQIAGDLIPNATDEQLAATGFHRNTLTSREGGIDVEQLRDEQVMDRANTLGAVWLGLTVECARCHDHKFDPISQKEYYQLFAFFNGAAEVNVDSPVPAEIDAYLRRRPAYETKLATLLAKHRVAELQPKWEAELKDAAAHPEARLEWTQNLDYVRVYLDHGPEILMLPPAERTWKQSHGLTRVFLKSPGPLGSRPEAQSAKLGEGFKEFEELDAEYPGLSELPVIRETANPPKTYIHLRGDFRSPGVEVQPGTPAVLPPMPAGATPNRMALARWLVSPQNPLTARVAVDRIWQELFGAGLVATSSDFGTRGDPPSHPELLDFLASEFQDGWNVKRLQKLIVMSAAYRQSSKSRPDLEPRDPSNILLARQSRLRLPAETIRDASLAVSGLLNPEVGGRSIRPPMPKGMLGVAYRANWKESQGPDRYRRGLYIFLQRSIPYPLLINFDAPSSLVTCTRRERSTTPLQALTLLNDPVFFEAAQALAARVSSQPGDLPRQIDYAFELSLGRPPQPDERRQLMHYYDSAKPAATAWTGLASVLLNLDEFITRE